MTQEPNKCCGAFYGCDKCKNKQVYLDKLAEDYLLSSVERNQYGDELSFIDGYKLAQKTHYSEEEVLILLHERDVHNMHFPSTFNKGWKTPKEWFKKK